MKKENEHNPKRKITNIVPFQLNISVITPPKAKLKNGTIIIILLTVARILAASRLPYESLIIGIKMVPAAAAPIPCNTLAKTNSSKDSDNVAVRPPAVKSTKPKIKGGLRPYRSEREPKTSGKRAIGR